MRGRDANVDSDEPLEVAFTQNYSDVPAAKAREWRMSTDNTIRYVTAFS